MTGVGREIGIGTSIARRLAETGWDIGFTFWQPYDARQSCGMDADMPSLLVRQLEGAGGGIELLCGARSTSIEADLADVTAAKAVFDQVNRELGPVEALVLSHCESNAINPGPTDTGWMNGEALAALAKEVPLGRVGLPNDCANLVAFLCSPEGGWINGQLLHSDGGLQSSI